MTGTEHDLIRVAASQYGLLEKNQVDALGLSDDQVQTRLNAGRWRNPRRGVYIVGAAPESRHQQLLAACLAAGPDAVASHRAAAWLWGFEGFATSPLEITVVEGRGPRTKGVLMHRTRRFDPADRTTCHGIPVTTRQRTLLDLGAVVRPRMVEAALHGYLRSGGTVTKIEARMNVVGGRGARGVGVLRAILEQRDPGRPLGSTLEVVYRRLVVAYGYDPGIAQYEVALPDGRRIFIDRAYPDPKVAIELNGYGEHASKAAFQRDHERYVYLARMGWTNLCFTYEDVTRNPDYVIGSLVDTVPLSVLMTLDRRIGGQRS